jgi:hypothetical protein
MIVSTYIKNLSKSNYFSGRKKVLSVSLILAEYLKEIAEFFLKAVKEATQ